MPYLIWKIETATGAVVRPMPILFSTMDQASAEAACLNERFQSVAGGCIYVAKETQEDALRMIDFEVY